MAASSKTVAIQVDSLSKNFGSNKALSDVNFDVPLGSIFGFLGPNGAGKTTTIRCLMNFIKPSAGTIKIFDQDSRIDSTNLKRSIGYLSSDSQLNPNWTGQDHIELFESIKGRNRKRTKLVDRLGLDIKTKVKALSSGNKQKLSIVLCLTGDPQLLIMDEPTRGLDPLLQNELYKILADFVKDNKAVFFSSHNLNEVERICDSVLLIRKGKIVEEKTMDDIRDMKIHLVTASTSQTFDIKKLRSLANVELVEKSANNISFKVKGDLNPSLQALLQRHLTDISINHVSLEDVFLEQYKG
ncbi:MAG: ATP-binding cassette domain-containing protein [Candidatus Saccharimonadales bacterium]